MKAINLLDCAYIITYILSEDRDYEVKQKYTF